MEGLEIHAAEIRPERAHMLASTPPKMSDFMESLKGEKRRHAVCAIWRVEIQASKSSVPAPGHYGDTAEYIRHPPPHGIDWPRQQPRNVFEPW